MKKIFFVFIFAVGLMVSVVPCFAHSLWIEKDPAGSLGVCFGEYGEGLREKSGGKLDAIANLEAWTVGVDGQKTVLPVKKLEDRFLLEGAKGEVIAQDVKRTIRKPKPGAAEPMHGQEQKKVSRSFLYTRFSENTPGLKSELRLDVLLTGATGHVVVFFDGKPLADAKGAMTAPNGWSKEVRADKEGRMTLEMPWPGLYLLDVTHELEQSGQYEGTDYQSEKHHIAFSFEKG